MSRSIAVATLIALSLVAAGCADSGPAPDQIMVFAAASLRDALIDIGRRFSDQEGIEPVFNFAGSNVLAQQIRAAPQADLFLSADELWVDELEGDGLLVPGSRRVFLGNRLAVVAHPGLAIRIEALDRLGTASFRYLALADPDAVPAGRYARQTLQRIATDTGTLWEAVRDRVVPAADVRAALALAESTPGTLAIVYRSDLAAGSVARLLLSIPAEATPPIRYVAAAVRVRAPRAGAQRFLDYLGTDTARVRFRAYGFEPLA